jgi:hypothetical protein
MCELSPLVHYLPKIDRGYFLNSPQTLTLFHTNVPQNTVITYFYVIVQINEEEATADTTAVNNSIPEFKIMFEEVGYSP